MSTRNRFVLAGLAAMLLLAFSVMKDRADNRRYEELQSRMAAESAATAQRLGELQAKNDQEFAASDKKHGADLARLATAALHDIDKVRQDAEAGLQAATKESEQRLDALKGENAALHSQMTALESAQKTAVTGPSNESAPDLTEIWKNAEGVVHVDIYSSFIESMFAFTDKGFEMKRFQIDGLVAHLTAFVLEPQADGSDGDYQYLASAGHIHDASIPIKELWCSFRDGLNLPSEKLELVGYDHRYDLSLLRFRKGYRFPGKALRLGCSDSLQPGDKVVALGCPLSAEFVITEGEVMDTTHVGVTKGVSSQPQLIVHCAQITFGNSGGPLILKRTGEVVGVNVMLEDSPGGYFMATPSSDLKTMYARLRSAHGLEVKHSQLEHAAFENSWRMNPNDWRDIGVPAVTDRCVVVTEVMKDSVADKSGLKAGDIVLSWNDAIPKDEADLWRMITNIVPGTAVGTMKVQRGTETKDVRIALGIFKGQVFVHKRYKVTELK